MQVDEPLAITSYIHQRLAIAKIPLRFGLARGRRLDRWKDAVAAAPLDNIASHPTIAEWS